MNKEQLYTKFEKWQKASPLSAYVILKDGKHVATIQFRGMDKARLEVILATIKDGSRTLHYGWASGGGYDRHTGSLDRLRIGEFSFEDNSARWDTQLLGAGFEVIAAVW